MGQGQQGVKGGYRSSIGTIKHSDPHAREIIKGSYHVDVFTFNDETNEWLKTFQEASVFVYSRNANPKYVLFIDYCFGSEEVALLTAEKRFKIDGHFLFYKNELDRTRCFRFETEDDCNRIGKLIQQIMERIRPIRSQQMVNYGGILAMLAQEEFDKSALPNLENKGISSHAIITPVMSFAAASNPAIKHAPKKRMLPEHIRVDQIEKRQRRSVPPLLRKLLDTVNQTSSSSDHLLLPSKAIHSTQETESSELPAEPLSSKIPTYHLTDVNGTDSTKPQLCSPLMFTATNKSSRETGIPTLLTPTTESVSPEEVRVNQSEAHAKPEPLTQNQLLQAISYLMKTDQGFVHKLHDAYLQSFVEMLHPN